MNDLMTKSFLSYGELKERARVDLESDIEKGSGKEENLFQFYQEADSIKSEMEEITNLLHNLQTLHEQAKSAHSAKSLCGLRDQTDSDVLAILRKAQTVKSHLEGLDQSNAFYHALAPDFQAGTLAHHRWKWCSRCCGIYSHKWCQTVDVVSHLDSRVWYGR